MDIVKCAAAVGSSYFVFSCLSLSKYFIMHHEQIYKHKLT